MKKITIIILSLLGHCCFGQAHRPSLERLTKAIDKPIWKFHTKGMDSCDFIGVFRPEFYRFDTIIAFVTSKGRRNWNGVDREHLYVISANTGKTLWTLDNKNGYLLCYFEKDKIISVDTNTITCYQIYNGKINWTYHSKVNFKVWETYTDTLSINLILYGDYERKTGNTLLKLNINTGTIDKEFFNLTDLGHGYIYSHFDISQEWCEMNCLDLNTGKVLWRIHDSIPITKEEPRINETVWYIPYYYKNDILYYTLEKKDSVFFESINFYTGNQSKKVFIGRAPNMFIWYISESYMYISIYSPFSDHYCYYERLDPKNLKTMWVDSVFIGDDFSGYYSANEQYCQPFMPLLDSSNFYYYKDTNIVALNKKTGKKAFCETPHSYIQYIETTNNFIFLQCIRSFETYESYTKIMSKDLPNEKMVNRNISLLEEDKNNNLLYLLDFDTKSLLKIKL